MNRRSLIRGIIGGIAAVALAPLAFAKSKAIYAYRYHRDSEGVGPRADTYGQDDMFCVFVFDDGRFIARHCGQEIEFHDGASTVVWENGRWRLASESGG